MSRKQHVFHGIKGQLTEKIRDILSWFNFLAFKTHERTNMTIKSEIYNIVFILCRLKRFLRFLWSIDRLAGNKKGQSYNKLNNKYNCESCSMVKFQQYDGQLNEWKLNFSVNKLHSNCKKLLTKIPSPEVAILTADVSSPERFNSLFIY